MGGLARQPGRVGQDALDRGAPGVGMLFTDLAPGQALRHLGVERKRAGNLVAELAELFSSRRELCLVVPVEGTRGYVGYWKSGFYHIARAANVPIVMSYLDYPRTQGGFGPACEPTGDVRADMDRIREFYTGKEGKTPRFTGRIRLREEDQELDATGT